MNSEFPSFPKWRLEMRVEGLRESHVSGAKDASARGSHFLFSRLAGRASVAAIWFLP
jgi:hypothetical protein